MAKFKIGEKLYDSTEEEIEGKCTGCVARLDRELCDSIQIIRRTKCNAIIFKEVSESSEFKIQLKVGENIYTWKREIKAGECDGCIANEDSELCIRLENELIVVTGDPSLHCRPLSAIWEKKNAKV